MSKQRIPLKDLKRLDELAHAAKQANVELVNELERLALDIRKTDADLSAKLLDYSDRFSSASADCNALFLQMTWLGDPSEDKKNHSVREPNIVSGPSTFSRAEYEEAFGDT